MITMFIIVVVFVNATAYIISYMITQDSQSKDALTNIFKSDIYDERVEEDIPSIIAHWKFDENSGNIANEEYSELDGFIYGADWTQGVTNSALQFDGIDDYIEVEGSEQLELGDEISFSVWVKAQENKTAKIFEKGDWDGNGLGFDKWNGWKASFRIDGSTHSVDWDEGIPDFEEWYFITSVYDGEAVKIYVNGELKNLKLITGNLSTNSRTVKIGATGGQKYFNGYIDEPTIYNQALTEEQIAQIYEDSFNLEEPPFIQEEGIIANWKFDEGSGDILIDSEGSYDGEIHGATWVDGIIGSALYFDGDNDQVEIIEEVEDFHDSVFNFDGNYSISAWVNEEEPDNAPGWQNIIGKGGDNGWLLQHGYGNKYFEFAARTDESRQFVTSNTSPEDDTWYYVVGVYDGSELSFYVNGELEVTRSLQGVINDTFEPVIIGAFLSGTSMYRYFNGIIDEVTIYNKALSLEEIQESYNEVLSAVEPDDDDDDEEESYEFIYTRWKRCSETVRVPKWEKCP